MHAGTSLDARANVNAIRAEVVYLNPELGIGLVVGAEIKENSFHLRIAGCGIFGANNVHL